MFLMSGINHSDGWHAMSAPLDIDQLHTFIAIIDSGSFTKAADRVFKTQSAVSMQMRRLEERLGKQLFAKDGRGNRLTAEGEKLMHYARRIIRLNNEAVAAFDDNRLEGTLRIGTPDDYADRYMPEIIGRFAKTHPNVELYIVCEPSVSLAEKMARGELDIALVTHNPRARTSDIVRTEPLCWVASANHPLRDDVPVPLAVGRRDCHWRQLAASALDADGRDYQVLFTSWSSTVIAAAVLAGMAVSVLPESTLRTGMRVLTAADGFPPLPPVQIGLMKRPGLSPSLINAITDHITACLDNISLSSPPDELDGDLKQFPKVARLRTGQLAPGW
jgi:DNA-binding transcriptional LysR family regulator